MYNYKLLGVVFNSNLCHHHAEIFISSKPEGLFQCTSINYLPRGKNSYRSGINYLYHGIRILFGTVCTGDFDLEFEFDR
jgi:hypothetical protein